MANPKEKTPMCLVNELARFNKVQPEYKLLSEQGPAHSKVSQLLLHDTPLYTFLFLATSHNHLSSPSFLPLWTFKIFSVRLTLREQQWEAEGTSIKKAQHSAAAAALAETTLPKPTMRTPRNTGRNPGGRLPLPRRPLALCCDASFLIVFLLLSTVGGMTHTMELNALCMKIGKKPLYKPLDPYPGMRPPNFNYNVRAPGPYQRSMQQ